MRSTYQPRRPRASPLWQLLTAAWEAFLASYEKKHRPTLGPLRPNVFNAVRNFLRCGDLLHLLLKTATILRFRAGSFEWQAIGKLTEAKNALRSLGEVGPHSPPPPRRQTRSHRRHSSLPQGKLRMAGLRRANGSEECPS